MTRADASGGQSHESNKRTDEAILTSFSASICSMARMPASCGGCAPRHDEAQLSLRLVSRANATQKARRVRRDGGGSRCGSRERRLRAGASCNCKTDTTYIWRHENVLRISRASGASLSPSASLSCVLGACTPAHEYSFAGVGHHRCEPPRGATPSPCLSLARPDLRILSSS